MPVITISGHSRKVGKTSIAEGLIAALPEYGWTALKVSSHLHSGSHFKDYAVIEETERDGGNDTSRFLKAGALRALWIQAERIETAIPSIQAIIRETPNVIIEGNSVLDYITADFSIMAINRDVAEFKESARGIILRANALVIIHGGEESPEIENLLKSAPKQTLRFETDNPGFFPPVLAEQLRSRFFT